MDKRKHSRASADFEAAVVMDGVSYEVVTCNLSMKGVLAAANEGIVEGRECEVRIPLAAGIRIMVEGRVIRSDAESVAIEFTSMDDESFSLMHRLMQLNADDPDRIDEELRMPGFAD